jgi:hypothetical protein
MRGIMPLRAAWILDHINYLRSEGADVHDRRSGSIVIMTTQVIRTGFPRVKGVCIMHTPLKPAWILEIIKIGGTALGPERETYVDTRDANHEADYCPSCL